MERARAGQVSTARRASAACAQTIAHSMASATQQASFACAMRALRAATAALWFAPMTATSRACACRAHASAAMDSLAVTVVLACVPPNAQVTESATLRTARVCVMSGGEAGIAQAMAAQLVATE